MLVEDGQFSAFQPPEPGDHVRIELLTGISRAGVIQKVRADSVVIRTPEGEATYPRQVIAPSSRRLLRVLADEDFTPDDLGFSSNVQYVIAGTNTIFIYRGRD